MCNKPVSIATYAIKALIIACLAVFLGAYPAETAGSEPAGADAKTKGASGDEIKDEEKAPEEKITIAISEKEVESKVCAYKMNLDKIGRDAEANIKKVDDALKAEDFERGAKQHYDRGSAFYAEGRLKDAKKELECALSYACDQEFKARIRAMLKKVDLQLEDEKGNLFD